MIKSEKITNAIRSLGSKDAYYAVMDLADDIVPQDDSVYVKAGIMLQKEAQRLGKTVYCVDIGDETMYFVGDENQIIQKIKSIEP